MKLIFESHATSFDNENGIASGWNEVDLSPLGIEQAKELGERYRNNLPDLVVTSDLKRARRTVEFAFQNSGIPIIFYKRLRECDYGAWTGFSSVKVEADKKNRIETPFPGGESYEMASQRVIACIRELAEKYPEKTVMVVGHRATQYGIEKMTSMKSLLKIVTGSWKWQPGWTYTIKSDTVAR